MCAGARYKGLLVETGGLVAVKVLDVRKEDRRHARRVEDEVRAAPRRGFSRSKEGNLRRFLEGVRHREVLETLSGRCENC